MGGTLRREKKLAEVVLGEKRVAGETPFRDFLPISFVNIRQFSVVVGLVRTPFVRCVCCVGWLCVCVCVLVHFVIVYNNNFDFLSAQGC